MTTLYNVMFALAVIVFLWVIFSELASSQKVKEDLDSREDKLRLVVIVCTADEGNYQNITHFGNDLRELQEFLNLLTFASVVDAKVWEGRKVAYVMNNAGVLEAV